MIPESWQSSESLSPLSISYAMASWSPSRSWTTDVTCSRTTNGGAGGFRSRLQDLPATTSMPFEYAGGVADATNTDPLWWMLLLGSTSTAGRLSAFQFETPLTRPTSLSREPLAVCLLFAAYATDESEAG